jgi:nucleotide-binding universal stress UspA family protein
MIKSILIPYDFSHAAANAIKYSVILCRKLGAKMILLNQEADNDSLNITEIMPDSSEKDNKIKDIVKMLEEKKDVTKNKPSQETIIKGILNAAKNKSVDILVMGIKNKKQALDYFFSSTVEETIIKSDIPVLAISGTNGIPKKLKNIVLALDVKKEIHNLNNQIVKEISRHFNAKIHLLHVIKQYENNQNEALQIMNEFAKNNGFRNFTLNIRQQNLADKGILNFSQQIQADLMVVSPDNTRSIENPMYGSITHLLLEESDIPVLNITLKIV